MEDENPEQHQDVDAQMQEKQHDYTEPAKPWHLTESDKDLLRKMRITPE